MEFEAAVLQRPGRAEEAEQCEEQLRGHRGRVLRRPHVHPRACNGSAVALPPRLANDGGAPSCAHACPSADAETTAWRPSRVQHLPVRSDGDHRHDAVLPRANTPVGRSGGRGLYPALRGRPPASTKRCRQPKLAFFDASPRRCVGRRSSMLGWPKAQADELRSGTASPRWISRPWPPRKSLSLRCAVIPLDAGIGAERGSAVCWTRRQTGKRVGSSPATIIISAASV